jgi:hypothetical protein
MTETVAVYAAPDAVTAEIMRGMLAAEGIEAVVGEQVANAYAGALAVGEGYWGELRVLPEDADRAREALRTYGDSDSAVSDEELDAEAQAASDPGV